MQSIYDWFQHLYDTTGINLNYIYDDFDRARMLKGFWLTLDTVRRHHRPVHRHRHRRRLAAGLASFKWLRLVVAGFISLFRNTPPLVQIYFFYFGLGYVLPRVPDASGSLQPLLSNVQWAIISLSLFAGAFNIEIFRSGIEAVSRSTIEAAESARLFALADLSQRRPAAGLPRRLPALGNNLVNLVKTTNLAYAIAVPELHVHRQADLGRRAQRARDDVHRAHLLRLPRLAVRLGHEAPGVQPARPRHRAGSLRHGRARSARGRA